MSRPVSQAAATAARNFPSGGIIAWDLSRTTGWCYGRAGDTTPMFGTLHLSDTTADARFVAFEDRVADMLEEIQPGQVVLEKALPLPAHNSMFVTSQQLTLASLVRMEAWRSSVPVFEIDCATVRQDILGRRWFAKDTAKREAMRFCLRRGWKVANHHQADAALVWLWYTRLIRGVRPSAGPLFTEMAA